MTSKPRKAARAIQMILPVTTMLMTAPALAAEGKEPRACVAGEPSIIVHVKGFKNDAGNVRAQIYGPNPATFLAKGEWTARSEKRRDGTPTMRFCFPVSTPGRYAIAIRHDANGNAKSDWNDGGGFSRNPSLSVFNMKPKFDEVAVDVKTAPVEIEVEMQYRQGLSIKPWHP
jgi:uncharacterized protein (DUF2141 family)